MKKVLFSLFATACLMGPAHAQLPGNVPANGLQGWWPFDGNANDLSGNGHHGIVSGATPAVDRIGQINHAYAFNGSSDYIYTTYNGILGSNPRAVSFWASTTDSTTEMAAVAWGANTFSPNQGAKFGCEFNVFVSGITIDGADCSVTYFPASPFATGKWHHYVFQFSSPLLTNVNIYMDGVLLTQVAYVFNGSSTLNTLNSFDVHFGKMVYSIPYYFKGSLDDIGIWDRPLTQNEIRGLYTGHSLGLNETSGTPAYLSLQPNPATDQLSLTLHAEGLAMFEGMLHTELYTPDGRLVKTVESEISLSPITIHLEGLPTGLYFLKASSKKYVQYLKFVKD